MDGFSSLLEMGYEACKAGLKSYLSTIIPSELVIYDDIETSAPMKDHIFDDCISSPLLDDAYHVLIDEFDAFTSLPNEPLSHLCSRFENLVNLINTIGWEEIVTPQFSLTRCFSKSCLMHSCWSSCM